MNTLHDLTFILNGTFGLSCAVILLFSIKSDRTVNTYLAIMVFLVSIRFILRGYYELTNQPVFIANISKSIAFVFGFPLPYLYCKQLVFQEILSKEMLSNTDGIFQQMLEQQETQVLEHLQIADQT